MSCVTLICILIAIQLISCECRTFKSGLPKGYSNLAYGSANNLAYYLPSMVSGSYMPFSTNGRDYGSPRQLNANQMPNNGFLVTSSSSIIPTGVSFISDSLVMDGILKVFGQLPVLGTVTLDGNVHNSGQGAVSYGSATNLPGINFLPGYNSGFANPVGYNLVKNYVY